MAVDDDVQVESGGEPEEIQGNESQQEQETQPQQEGVNPAWQPILDELDDLSQQVVLPKLKEFDQKAQQRVEESNAKYAPWKAFEDAGWTPDTITEAVNAVQYLNTPDGQVELYKNLHEFLEKEGRRPTFEEAQQIQAQTAADGVEDEPHDPRVDKLEERFQKMDQAEQDRADQDQEERNLARIRQEIDAEFAAVQQAHPEFEKEDFDAIQEIAAGANARIAAAGQPGYFTVAQATDRFLEMQQRLLTKKRAPAPRLTPPGGSAPAPANNDTRRPADVPQQEFSKEMADYLTSLEE